MLRMSLIGIRALLRIKCDKRTTIRGHFVQTVQSKLYYSIAEECAIQLKQLVPLLNDKIRSIKNMTKFGELTD